MAARILTIENLRTQFVTKRGPLMAAAGVSFHVDEGEVLGIVGESGCGKSVTALSVMRLIEAPGRIVSGRIDFMGRDLLSLDEQQMRKLRGNRISMVFQDPTVTLNPVLKIGAQVTEVLACHADMRGGAARRRAIELLDMVGIPSPRERLKRYPHQLSGGMQQRVVIAIGLALQPDLLIADEPTTALDVVIQAEILDLLHTLQQQSGGATVVITHDIGVVANYCQRVVVMYCGKIVESGTVADVLEHPKHPYTAGLLGALPSLGRPVGQQLEVIPGVVPDPVRPPSGCRFHPRCQDSSDRCQIVEPLFVDYGSEHYAACHLYSKSGGDAGG